MSLIDAEFKRKLIKKHDRLKGFGGKIVKPMGQIQMLLKTKVSRVNVEQMLTFQIVKGPCSPILSLGSCEQLGIIKRVESVEKEQVNHNAKIESLIEANKDLFEGLG